MRRKPRIDAGKFRGNVRERRDAGRDDDSVGGDGRAVLQREDESVAAVFDGVDESRVNIGCNGFLNPAPVLDKARQRGRSAAVDTTRRFHGSSLSPMT